MHRLTTLMERTRMQARIYRQTKPAGQSGLAGTHTWILEYGQSAARHADPLMGWVGSSDTMSQIHLKFSSKEDAEAYAKRNAIGYTVAEPAKRILKPKMYAANFAANRIGNWTH
jgi:predicted RNase H-related nuclease YkuK (DUF458 family)